jgi:hypothetical protein
MAIVTVVHDTMNTSSGHQGNHSDELFGIECNGDSNGRLNLSVRSPLSGGEGGGSWLSGD